LLRQTPACFAGWRFFMPVSATACPVRALVRIASKVAAMSWLAAAARSMAAVSCVRTTFAKASAAKRKPLPLAECTSSNGMLLAMPCRMRNWLGK